MNKGYICRILLFVLFHSNPIFQTIRWKSIHVKDTLRSILTKYFWNSTLSTLFPPTSGNRMHNYRVKNSPMKNLYYWDLFILENIFSQKSTSTIHLIFLDLCRDVVKVTVEGVSRLDYIEFWWNHSQKFSQSSTLITFSYVSRSNSHFCLYYIGVSAVKRY